MVCVRFPEVACLVEQSVFAQPVFDVAQLDDFLPRVAHHGVPIIAGVWPLVSLRNAEFLANNTIDKINALYAVRKREICQHVFGSVELALFCFILLLFF